LLALFRPVLAWSPILVRQIEIQALGFVLRRLQLNRHREAEVAAHRHAHAQLILYLSGEGVQTVKRPAASRPRGRSLRDSRAHAPRLFRGRAAAAALSLVPHYALEGCRPRSLRRTARSRPPRSTSFDRAAFPRSAQGPASTSADYPAILAVVARLLEHSPAAADAPLPPCSKNSATTSARRAPSGRSPATSATIPTTSAGN
jgi:hypothetical protein